MAAFGHATCYIGLDVRQAVSHGGLLRSRHTYNIVPILTYTSVSFIMFLCAMELLPLFDALCCGNLRCGTEWVFPPEPLVE